MNWSQCERVLMSVIVRTWVSAWSCMWSSWSIWHTRPCSTQTRLKDRREESSVHVSLQCKSWAHYNTNVESVYIEHLTVSLNDAVAVIADVSEQLKHTCDTFGSWAEYLDCPVFVGTHCVSVSFLSSLSLLSHYQCEIWTSSCFYSIPTMIYTSINWTDINNWDCTWL